MRLNASLANRLQQVIPVMAGVFRPLDFMAVGLGDRLLPGEILSIFNSMTIKKSMFFISGLFG
jgi:hypothetical protein